MSKGTRVGTRSVAVACAATAMVWNFPARAQESEFEGRRILAVRYKPAEQPLTAADLKRVQILIPGAPLRSAEVAEAIDRLFATGRYTNIEVSAEAEPGGVVITFLTENQQFLGHVSASGKISSPPNAALIVDSAQLDLGTPLAPGLLETAQKNIQHLFASNGLYQATVRLETVPDPAHQQLDVHIIVDSGARARYEAPVIQGDAKLPDSAIIRATGWRLWLIGRWRKVTEALTRGGVDGIERKYQKEDRLTARVDLQALDYDPQSLRVKPTLQIQAGPKIRIRALEAKVSKGRLKRYVPIYQEGAVDPDLLVEGERNLRDYFQSKGYPDVDVSFRILPPQHDEQTIEYFISRGPRRKLVRVLIRGNRYFDTETIRARMFLEPATFYMRWGRYSDAFRSRDEESIADLYKANGFREVRVVSRVENNYGGKERQIAVIFSITEGPQWLVSRLDLVGIQHLDAKALRSLLSEEQGQPYSEVSVAEDRSAILTACYAKGFRECTFQFKTSPAGPHQVNISYRMNEGPQEFVRDVILSGLHSTRRSLVTSNLHIRPGDPLSLPAGRAAQQNLYDLGVFAEIDTAVQNSDGDTRDKYVLFDFTEAHKYNMNFGVGAEIAQLGPTTTTISEPVGGAGFSPRLSVDVNRLNLWGLGHTLALQTRVSSLEQRVSLSYIDPRLLNDAARSLTFSVLYDTTRDVRTFSSHREEGAVQFAQKFSRGTAGLLRFAYRRVSTSDVVIPALLVPQFLQPVRIGIFSGNLVQDHRDNPVDPHTGMYNSIDVGVASRAFGSQRSFMRFLGRNATYYRLSRNVVLARQLTFGAILPFDIPSGLSSSEAVPLPERFFGGGNISLRAFPENQAGPRDTGSPVGPGGTQTVPTGFPLGGDAVLISNIELRFPLIGDNIGGVLFHDAGNIYSSVGDISFRFHQRNRQDFNYMVHAVGFGIRYKTPVGPLRVDLGYSINPPRFEGFSGTVQQLLTCNPNLPPSQLPAQCQPTIQSIGRFQYFFSIGQTF